MAAWHALLAIIVAGFALWYLQAPATQYSPRNTVSRPTAENFVSEGFGLLLNGEIEWQRFSEVQEGGWVGEHLVIHAASVSDVVNAFNLSIQSRRQLYVRSGSLPLRESEIENKNMHGAILLNMGNFQEMRSEMTEHRTFLVSIGAAITVQQLGDYLLEHGLWIPLDINPSRTIVSSIMRNFNNVESYLTSFSNSTLREHLESFDVVLSANSAAATAKKGSALFTSVLTGDVNGVITELTFRAFPLKELRFWRTKACAMYAFDSTGFEDVAGNYLRVASEAPPTIHYMMRLYSDPSNVASVCFVVTGNCVRCDADSSAVHFDFAEWSICRMAPQLCEDHHLLPDYWTVEYLNGVELIESALKNTEGSKECGEYDAPCWEYEGKLALPKKGTASTHITTADLQKKIGNIVHHSRGRTEGGQILPGFTLSFCLQTVADGLFGSAQLFGIRHVGDEERTLLLRKELSALLHRRDKRTGLINSPMGLSLRPYSSSDVAAMMPSPDQRGGMPAIFKGLVIQPGSVLYNETATAYASHAHRIYPYLVIYPLDVNDIKVVLSFAENLEERKKVVSYSGDCHVSGHLSHGKDTIVLDMKHFDVLEVTGSVARIGAGCRLGDITEVLSRHGVTLPLRAESHIGIGAHVQTGGFGLFARSLGLALDYVRRFQIVLADGSVRWIHRPEPHGDRCYPAHGNMNERLFFAVLGGGPGSFGIVTEIEFDVITDNNYPRSWGYQHTALYDKAALELGLQLLGRWVKEDIGEGFPTASVSITVRGTSALHTPSPNGYLILDMVDLDYPSTNHSGRPVVADMIEAVSVAKQSRVPVNWGGRYATSLSDNFTNGLNGLQKLSDLSKYYARDAGSSVNEFGKEWICIRRSNVFPMAPTQSFIHDIVELVDEAQFAQNVKPVMRVMFLGGNSKTTEKRFATALAHREAAWGLTFDLYFRTEAGRVKAVNLQSRMELTIVKYAPSVKSDWRLLGAPYGEADFSLPEVPGFYIQRKQGSRPPFLPSDVYACVQTIKKEVDPFDFFRSPSTVRLPKSYLGDTDSCQCSLESG